MTPIEVLKLLAEPLLKEKIEFAVCGGVAASIYRTSFRMTNDLDIAIALPGQSGAENEQNFAVTFLTGLGFKTSVGWAPRLIEAEESNIFFVVGESERFVPRVDMLLPNLPWVRQAVMRAQWNRVDYQFARLPTITPEDLIISKAFALRADPNRPYDRDDIESILQAGSVEDQNYLEENLSRFNLNLSQKN